MHFALSNSCVELHFTNLNAVIRIAGSNRFTYWGLQYTGASNQIPLVKLNATLGDVICVASLPSGGSVNVMLEVGSGSTFCFANNSTALFSTMAAGGRVLVREGAVTAGYIAPNGAVTTFSVGPTQSVSFATGLVTPAAPAEFETSGLSSINPP